MRVRVSQYIVLVKKVVMELNLFRQDPSDDRQIRYQRIATRFYIVMIICSLTVLGTYTFLTVSVHHDTVFNPSEPKYIELEHKYPTSLSCPCSSISVSYSAFMTIQPEYHQACSSDLITVEWIVYNFLLNNDLYLSLGDYRLYAGSQFQTLAVSCAQSKRAIKNALGGFLQTQLVSSQVISKELFQSQFESLIHDWQFTTTKQLLSAVKLILATTQGNRLTSGYLNVDFTTNGTSRTTKMKPEIYGNCSCALSQSCREVMAIYEFDLATDDDIPIFSIPNFFVGCYLVDSFLASTLECFYNRSCMLEIDQHVNGSLGESFNFSPLNASSNSAYQSIGEIFDKLMVDSWSSNVAFTSYYQACAPLKCTFDNERRMDVFLVITTVVGIFGGLSLGFKILLTIILHIIERLLSGVSGSALMYSIKNLFIRRDERHVTRQLHFVLMATTLFIAYIASAFAPRSIIGEIQKPSLSTYQDLAIRFPDSLQCPCSHISIKYKSFITIVPRFHQVCSSDFVSDQWISYLYGDGDLTERFAPTDFQYSASSQFQLLASLCRLSQETVRDTLTQLATSDFVDGNVLSVSALNERIRTTISELEATVPNLYVSTLSLIRVTTGANMLLSASATSWVFDTPTAIVHESNAYTSPLIYQECSCGVSSKCVQPSRGMLAGCYALEALLQSTLHCVYNQDCIDPNNNFQAMQVSSSRLSRFDLNATIESIINHLMVEEYSSNVSYEEYFDQCAPSSCTYSYTEHSAVLDGVTYLIGLYGGLMIICRSVAAIIVRLFWRRTSSVDPV